MPTLSEYVTQVRRLLHDPNGQAYSTSDLQAYINETRSQLALEAECVRVLYGYTEASAFSFAATAVAGSAVLTVASTALNAVGQLISGQSYIPVGAQIVRVNDATTLTMSVIASGAGVGSLTFTPTFNTVVGQEIYPYPTTVNTVLGIKDVIQVKSVAVNMGGSQGSVNAMLGQMDFTRYQAYFGYYGRTLMGYPALWCNYNGAVRMRPIPSAIYPMQWDTICSVMDLTNDTSPEPIPFAFTDSVKYFAAYLALMNSQRAADAKGMKDLYEEFTKRARSFVQRTFVPNVYR